MSGKKQQTKLAEKTNQSLNTTSRLPIKNINSSFVNTALTTIANGLSNIKPIDFSTILNPYPFDGASQEEIPVKNIYDGIVETYSGKFYGYIEILPINYYKKSYSDQVDVIRSYLDLFTDDFYRFHIKIMSDGAEPTDLINNIKSRNRREKDPKVISVLNDYVQFIYYLSSARSVTKRYFFIWEYTGTNGKLQIDTDAILEEMFESRALAIQILNNCGNLCVEPMDGDNYTRLTLKFLYYFYNRRSVKYESMDMRGDRLLSDVNYYNTHTEGKKKKLLYSDVLAPKGLYFDNRHFMQMDGLCYSYVGIDGNSWNTEFNMNWLDNLTLNHPLIDTDIVVKRAPRSAVKVSMAGYNKIAKEVINNSRYDYSIVKALAKKRADTSVIENGMKNGQNLYETGIFYTLRSESPKKLKKFQTSLENKIVKQMHLKTTSSYNRIYEYFKMTSPFVNYTKPFADIKHDLLTEDLACTYVYTAYKITDSDGFVLGRNVDKNTTMIAINNFFTKRYSNANMIILGTSGSGKSFTNMMIGRRMFFNGIRCFFIIPKKGYEYRRCVEAVNGSYIPLYPGSPFCINVLDIRPESVVDASKLSEDVVLKNNVSLLSQKVNFLITWLRLLACEESSEDYKRWFSKKSISRLNSKIIELYNRFGITDDNDSIYKDKQKGILKDFPIISDLYKVLKEDPDTADITELLDVFVHGNCQNMNGQTNVKIHKGFNLYDVDEDNIDSSLFPAFLFMAFDNCYSMVKENLAQRDAIFLDEVWKMLVNEQAAKLVENMVKIIRGYGGCSVVSTQEMKDLLRDRDKQYGASILGNADIKILLKMNKQDLDLVQKNCELSESEKQTIKNFPAHGRAMVVTNTDKIVVNMDTTEMERRDYTTDVNDRMAVSV